MENLNKEVETIKKKKKNQMEILKLKIIIFEMEKSPNELEVDWIMQNKG